jgi:hypothetical protein
VSAEKTIAFLNDRVENRGADMLKAAECLAEVLLLHEKYELALSERDSFERQFKALADELDRLKDAIDCACNALTDSISVGGNDRETNWHWVKKLRGYIK